MNLIKALTPQDTEEVKPGLFIQKTLQGYRQVYPAAWNGKINWKNFLLGGKFWKNFIIFLILMLIAFSYYQETKVCREFQSSPCKFLPNLTDYCYKLDSEETLKDGEFNINSIQIDS